MKKYTTPVKPKIKKLVRNPSKIKYLPNFLRIQKSILLGKTSHSIKGVNAEFIVGNRKEARRLSTIAGEKEIIGDIISEIGEIEEPVFFDIGANIGSYTCFIAKKADKTCAFEPFKPNAERLRENLAKNNLQEDVYEIALMNENSTMNLDIGMGNVGEGKIKVKDSGEDSTEAYKGDTFIQDENLPTPNIIKIDVEGSEFESLKGLENTLGKESCRALYIEIHRHLLPEFGATEEQLKNFLESKEFEIEKLDTRGNTEHIKAEKKP